MIIDIETGGLEPLTDAISCICIMKNNGVFLTFCGDNERTLLTEFWEGVDNNEEWIGFNSSSFDIPFIIKRSLINNIRMKKIGKSTDLRLIVNGFFYSYEKKTHGKLDDWCTILGCQNKVENGLKMVEYFQNKEFDKIKEHCEYDIKLTKLL